jgi:MFS transporter, DHA1 family, multidrug resistance protein
MVLRFLQGFFGSPCLATGGATMGDMYSLPYLPFSVAIWTAFAFCAPAIGPIVSGFSIPVKGWRWSMWEISWLSAPILVCWLFFLPETNPATILYWRAERLRKRTGNPKIRSQAEIDRKDMTAKGILSSAIIKPVEIMFKDWAVLYTNIYTSLTYGIYYSYFECFPLIYPRLYGFNAGETGLVFLSIITGVILGGGIYFAYVYWRLIPRMFAHPEGIFGLAPEWRLRPALSCVFIFTMSLIAFGLLPNTLRNTADISPGWTANENIHWSVSCVMLMIYGGAVFIVLQCVFVYIPLSYPQYTASLYAGNDFCRSLFAFGAILFGRPLYLNLGIGKGTTLLGGVSVIGIVSKL